MLSTNTSETNNIIHGRQYGFRQYRSTGYNLTYVTHTWKKTLETGKETLAVALDISKAFDQVWHKNLLAKLPDFGFTPTLRIWLESFLANSSIKVVVDGMPSESFSINAGVPQGSVISPTLFLIYINDLIDQTSSPTHYYADDNTLHDTLSLLNNRNNFASSITLGLKKLNKRGSQNLVSFNANKTQCCLISMRENKNFADILFGSNTLKMCDSLYKLGVSVASDLS